MLQSFLAVTKGLCSVNLIPLKFRIAKKAPSMPRSILFVTGNRADRIEKALATSADVICVDLEDGVAVSDKELARENVRRGLEYLEGDERVLYRVNHPSTEFGAKDLALFDNRTVAGVIVPKVESTADISRVRNVVGVNSSIFAIIESPLGMARIFDIAMAEGLTALLFGTGDWSKETGSDTSWDSLLYGRSLIIHAAALARITPLDGAYLNVRDQEGLKKETTKLRKIGFRGRIALHPDQVDTINTCFAPSKDELVAARRIVHAFEDAKGKTISVDGLMVDEPIYESAKNILAQAR